MPPKKVLELIRNIEISTSPHFNNYSKGLTGEQSLLEDLLNEIVYIAGADCFYILRESADEIDLVLGEDPTSKFERVYQMEMYIKNADTWQGGNDLFSKFGLKIDKQTNLVLTKRTFNKYVPASLAIRPREGDLVYIPPLQKLFEIKFVNKEEQFYTHGKVDPYYYELQLEMFKYSHEPINTGLEELDSIERESGYVIDLQLSTGSGTFTRDEVVYQGSDLILASVTAQVKNWDAANSIVSVYNIKGEFEPSENVIGLRSGATYLVADFDDLQDAEDYRSYQNADFQAEANTHIDRTEVNPFGTI